MSKDNSPPAFPVPEWLERAQERIVHTGGQFQNPMGYWDGMTLRDYFAGRALQGMIAGLYAGPNSGWTVEGTVVAAFEYADAMLKAREE